ncbi:MAG TPA: type II toxin-antitoxin system prevent-host-death family antitoxin, partial [Candidatus Dormibacteraeota bacterium]|nr:type II toxin-antitoxin system prevent-host-death family antitoxin [Candidatus Dormibacteraeota bacterium]
MKQRLKTIGAFDAKTHLSELLDQVYNGTVYLITKHGRPVAELRPPHRESSLQFGSDAGKITMSDDFEAPVPGMEEYSE